MDWVLIVDDDAQSRERTASILRKDGIKTTALASGRDFFDYIEGMTILPDLILLGKY